jgi:(p)ppGpp synthase/HD superfamily hydrolase
MDRRALGSTSVSKVCILRLQVQHAASQIKTVRQKKVVYVWLTLNFKFENSETSAVDFVEDFKNESVFKRNICFYPRRHQIFAKATDLAFSIHSEIGIKTRGTVGISPSKL